MSALQIDTVDLRLRHWLPDSGVSSHITHNLAFFDTYQSYEGPNIVVIGNGQSLEIQNIGTVTLHTSSGDVVLNDV